MTGDDVVKKTTIRDILERLESNEDSLETTIKKLADAHARLEIQVGGLWVALIASWFIIAYTHGWIV